MTNILAEKIKSRIPATRSAQFSESVRIHIDYLELKLVGFDKLARKLLHFINQPQQFCDFLTEAHWAMVLLHLGGTTEYEPMGESGPDLRFNYLDNKIDFHCKRIREDPKTADKLAGHNEILVEYGNVLDDSISVFDRITSEKPRNIDSTLPQMVAYWSDSERIEEHEFESAIEEIKTAAAEGRCRWVSGLIYKVRIFQHFEKWFNPYSTVSVPNKLQEIVEQLQPWPRLPTAHNNDAKLVRFL